MSRFTFGWLSPPRRTLLDLLLLALLCLLFFWRDLPWAGVDYRGFATGDFGNQFYPFAAYKAARLHVGQLPLWSPYALAGHPFLADIQSAVFYPPGLLTMLVTAFTGFSYHALQLEAILHYPVAAAGMYLLALRLLGSRLGAWVAALAFTFSAYLTGYPVLQLAILETVAWLPFILLALDRATGALAAQQRRAALAWTLLAGLLMGAALLAGHPQSAMFVFYGSVAFTLFRYFARGETAGPRPLKPILTTLVLFGAIAAGLAAAQLLPSLEYMQMSTRSALGIDAAGSGLTPYDLLQLVLPQISVPFAALYVGVLPLGLAIYALASAASHTASFVRIKDRALASYLAFLALLSLLLSFGALTPLYHLAYLLVPGWRLFRQQERLAVWVVFGLALLAGLGARLLAARRPHKPEPSMAHAKPDSTRWLVRGYWLGALVATLFALACFVGFVAGNQDLWGFTTSALLLALFLALAALVVWNRHPALLVALIVLDLFTLSARQHAGDASSAIAFPPAPVFEVPRSDRSVFRTFNEDALPGNYGYGYGLEDTNGASPLRLSTYDRLLEDAPKPLLWRLLGVKYVFTWRQELDVPAERVGEQPGKDGNPIYAYLLEETHPRLWFAGHAFVEPSPERQLSRLLEDGFDSRQQVVLDREPVPLPEPGCSGSAEWLERSPEFLALRVVADAPCILVLSEVAYPGWHASVDGASAALITADAVLRAVAVPTGEHRVELAFRPPLVTAGLIISGMTLLGVLLALVLARRTYGPPR